MKCLHCAYFFQHIYPSIIIILLFKTIHLSITENIIDCQWGLSCASCVSFLSSELNFRRSIKDFGAERGYVTRDIFHRRETYFFLKLWLCYCTQACFFPCLSKLWPSSRILPAVHVYPALILD